MSKKKVIGSLLKRDILYSYKKNVFKYLGVIFIISIISFSLINNLNNREDYNMSTIIFEFFKGISYESNFDNLDFPMIWFFINNLIIFILGIYVSDDLKVNGVYLMSRCSRRDFWTSKILCITITVIIYYIAIFLILLITGLLLHIKWDNYYLLGNIRISTAKLLLYIFTLYVTTSISLCILHSTLSLIINYNYSYIILIIVILASIFTKNNLMPAQHSLILRHIPFDLMHNLSAGKSLLYNFVLSWLLIMIGRQLISHKDILSDS